jgi:hypothetical protein
VKNGTRKIVKRGKLPRVIKSDASGDVSNSSGFPGMFRVPDFLVLRSHFLRRGRLQALPGPRISTRNGRSGLCEHHSFRFAS